MIRALLHGMLERLDRHVEVQPRSFGEIRTPALRKHLADSLRAYRKARRAGRLEAKVVHHEPNPDAGDVPPYLRPTPIEEFIDIKCPRFFGRQAG